MAPRNPPSETPAPPATRPARPPTPKSAPTPARTEARARNRKANLALQARKDMFSKAPGRQQMAMTSPKRSATISSSALRQVSDESPQTRRRRRNRAQTDKGWQFSCFDYAGKVGELGALLNLQSNIVSLCGFPVRVWDDQQADWVANDPDDETEEDEADTVAAASEATTASKTTPKKKPKKKPKYDDRPANVMRNLVGPDGGSIDLVRRAAYNLFCAGDCSLVGTPHPKDQGILWEFLSVLECYPNADGDMVRKRGGVGTMEEKLPDDNFTARLFRADIGYSDMADSEVKRVLPILQEIVTLTMMVDAIAKSRLAANMIFIPNELSFAAGSPEDGDVDEEGDDPAEGEDDDIDLLVDELFDHMTAPVNDAGSAARLVPLIIRGKGEFGQYIKVIDLSRQLDMWAQELRQEALQRLAQGLDAPPEAISGKGCLDDTSEILTMDGWKGIDELSVGDLVLGLDHVTGLTRWEPVDDVHRYNVIDEPMQFIDGAYHQSLTTGEHRWPVERHLCASCDRLSLAKGRCLRCWKRARRLLGSPPDAVPARVKRVWVTSAELNDGDRITLGAPHGGLPSSVKYSDAFVELLGWLATDGDTNRDRLRIRQSPTANPDNVARIDAALSAVLAPGDWNRVHDAAVGCDVFTINGAASRRLIEQAGSVADHRFILGSHVVHQLTHGQLLLLLDVGVAANGYRKGENTQQFAVDTRRLDAFELAAILTGNRVSRLSRPQTEAAFGDEAVASVSYGPRTRFGLVSTNRATQTFTGRVWCPTVRSTSSYLARRDGAAFYTGNSVNHWTAANIDSEFIVKHIQPIGILIADFLTWAYLRPFLEAYEGMTEDQALQYKVEFDPSPVIARADEAKSARDLSDWLSDEALLQANGFTKADMATDEQIRVRRLWQLVSTQPTSFAKLITLIPGFANVDPDIVGTPPPPDPALMPVPGDPNADGAKPTNGDGRAAEGQGKPAAPDGKTAKTGDQQPNTGKPDGAVNSKDSQMSVLVERVSVGADAAIRRAIEKAGSRIISLAQSRHPEVRERLRSVSKDRCLSLVTKDEMATFSMTPEKLLRGAWDEFSNDASSWIRSFMEDDGVDPRVAADTAQLASHNLCEYLQELAVAKLMSHWKPGRNGLRVSTETVLELIEQAAFAGAV